MLAFGLVLVAYVILFQFFIDDAARALSEWKRVQDSPANEIVFSDRQNEGECFYYLKNHAVSGEAKKNAVSDVFMLLPDTVYRANSIYFSGTLEKGTCAVSANVAARYGLAIGDFAQIMGTEKSFRVARLLPAQSGIDEDYRHEGIIILAYEEALLERNYSYVSFVTDGDAYQSLERLVFVEDMANGCARMLAFSACAAVGVILIMMIVCERFLLQARHRDYTALVWLGFHSAGLGRRVFAENFIKYILPAVLTVLFYAVFYACYASVYWSLAICFLIFCLILNAVYSLIVMRSLYYVGAK
ncbi:MAG: hypothetical protein IJZ80_09510 [Clostridia bacterium]|nr:hypothetical protein [Clostridia bacterium]